MISLKLWRTKLEHGSIQCKKRNLESRNIWEVKSFLYFPPVCVCLEPSSMAASIKLLFLLLISLSFTYITSEPEPEPEPQRFSLENILDQLKSHISVLGFLSFSICVCVWYYQCNMGSDVQWYFDRLICLVADKVCRFVVFENVLLHNLQILSTVRNLCVCFIILGVAELFDWKLIEEENLAK